MSKKLSLPIASLSEVEVIADALEAAARAHRNAGIGAAEAIEADRADGETVPVGAADQVLAILARAGVLDRLAAAARSAHAAATVAAATPAAATPAMVTCPITECRNPAELGKVCAPHAALAAALGKVCAPHAALAAASATPLFLPAGEAPVPPLAAAAAAMDPENELVDIFEPGAIT